MIFLHITLVPVLIAFIAILAYSLNKHRTMASPTHPGKHTSSISSTLHNPCPSTTSSTHSVTSTPNQRLPSILFHPSLLHLALPCRGRRRHTGLQVIHLLLSRSSLPTTRYAPRISPQGDPPSYRHPTRPSRRQPAKLRSERRWKRLGARV